MSAAGRSSLDKVSLGQKLGFGVGDFGLNLYYTFLNLFLYYYYTDILNIRPGVAGLIFAIPLFWDAVTDPVMGVLASRTRTRMGSFRPYILYGAVPLAFSFIGLFAAPLFFPGAVVVACAVSHVIFRTCYTVVSIPYSALSARITSDSQERGVLAGLRMLFAASSGLATVFLTLQLAAWLAQGKMMDGFFRVSLIYGAVASLILMLTFISTREQASQMSDARPSLADLGKFVRKNRALWILIAAIFLGSVGSNIAGKSIIYYVKYVANLDLSITSALTAMLLATTASIPCWMMVSRFVAKKTVWITGACFSILMQIILFVSPPSAVTPFLAILAVMGVGQGAFIVTFWSMLPDTVEYGEWRSGVRDEGVVFGLNQLALKAASGVGIAALGFMLEIAGYEANQVQSVDTIYGIRVIAILIPMIGSICVTCLIAFYPIDAVMHRRLLRAIRWRKARREAA